MPNLQHHYSSLSVSHDPSEIIVICWFNIKHVLLSVLKTIVLLNIFLETRYSFSPHNFFYEFEVEKNSIYLAEYLLYHYTCPFWLI